jgi:hypothetical protein
MSKNSISGTIQKLARAGRKLLPEVSWYRKLAPYGTVPTHGDVDDYFLINLNTNAEMFLIYFKGFYPCYKRWRVLWEIVSIHHGHYELHKNW